MKRQNRKFIAVQIYRLRRLILRQNETSMKPYLHKFSNWIVLLNAFVIAGLTSMLVCNNCALLKINDKMASIELMSIQPQLMIDKLSITSTTVIDSIPDYCGSVKILINNYGANTAKEITTYDPLISTVKDLHKGEKVTWTYNRLGPHMSSRGSGLTSELDMKLYGRLEKKGPKFPMQDVFIHFYIHYYDIMDNGYLTYQVYKATMEGKQGEIEIEIDDKLHTLKIWNEYDPQYELFRRGLIPDGEE